MNISKQFTAAPLATLFAGLWFCVPGGIEAQAQALDRTLGFSYVASSHTIHFSAPTNVAFYHVLQRSEDLRVFTPVAMSLGATGQVWEYSVPLGSGFYRVKIVSIFSPEDTDGDRIDDVFELDNPQVLDPLNGTDAGQIDPNGNGLTYLQQYHQTFGRDIPDGEVIGREFSVFNFGQPTAAHEAFSRELSVFNGESPPLTDIHEVYSREVSAFNFGVAFGSADALSREYSVFNFGQPAAAVEAFSREVSVYNGESPPLTDIQEAYSREWSVFNTDAPSAAVEAISREISVFNDIP